MYESNTKILGSFRVFQDGFVFLGFYRILGGIGTLMYKPLLQSLKSYHNFKKVHFHKNYSLGFTQDATFNILQEFITTDLLFSQISQIRNHKKFNFCYKEKRFQKKKNFFVKLNDLHFTCLTFACTYFSRQIKIKYFAGLIFADFSATHDMGEL